MRNSSFRCVAAAFHNPESSRNVGIEFWKTYLEAPRLEKAVWLVLATMFNDVAK